MPELSREELWRQLKQNVVAPVYVLFGVETYLRDRAVSQIVKHSFADTDLRDFNLDDFSLNNKDAIESAIAACQQLPMMSARRVVKVKDVRISASSNRDTLKEESGEVLGRYLADPSPTTVLILSAEELNGNRKLTRMLMRSAVTVKFDRLDDRELKSWIKRQFEDEGSQIDDLAIRRLSDLIGSDLTRFSNEIQKLSVASFPSNTVTMELIEALVPYTNETDNFALTDAIVSGRGRSALSILNKILNDGAQPVQLLGLLSYNFRRLLMAKEMMTRGEDRREIAQILKMPYRDQEDFLAAARRVDRNRLVDVFERVARADLAMKTSVAGGGDPGARMQIEVLVCQIACSIG